MAVHFHPIRVAQVKALTDHSTLVTLDIPEALRAEYDFKPGQHLTLKATVNGQELRRTYSLCTSPHQQQWQFAVKAVDGGKVSQWIKRHLKAGDVLDVMPPSGSFWLKQTGQSTNLLFIAAGSGITPLLSMIRFALYQLPSSSVTLLYSNRTKRSIMFREELEHLKDRFLQRFRLIHVLSGERRDAPLFHGRLDEEKLRAFFTTLIRPLQYGSVYLCGPLPMMQAARQALESAGVTPTDIHEERFTSLLSTPTQKMASTTLSGEIAEVKFTIDGVESRLQVPYEGPSILDAALQTGADLPFACKGGVCSTCRARLLQGKVEMDVVYGLEPDEVEAGIILTCQSHPRSPEVVVSYDAK